SIQQIYKQLPEALRRNPEEETVPEYDDEVWTVRWKTEESKRQEQDEAAQQLSREHSESNIELAIEGAAKNESQSEISTLSSTGDKELRRSSREKKTPDY